MNNVNIYIFYGADNACIYLIKRYYQSIKQQIIQVGN